MFLVENLGSKIYIRGTGVQESDFLMDGLKWELKTLNSPTENAVFNNIKKSLSKGNQGRRFIIDGRAGLDAVDGINGIFKGGRIYKC